MTHQEFKEMTDGKIVMLDGAMGSNLRAAGMPAGVSTELWASEHPDVVRRIQEAYVEIGSQILVAPTFMCNRIGLGAHGLEDRLVELNTQLVGISRSVCQGKAKVAGELGPTGKMLEPRGDISYAALLEVYKEQIKAMVDAGVDMIISLTMLSLDENMVALEAAQSVCDLPMLCSMTMESDGNLLYGGSAVEAVETLQEMGADAVGLNCSVGPDQLEAVISSMKAVAKVPILAKPNAGMPTMDEFGKAHYSMTPDEFAEAMRKLIWRGARIVGGCCGTTPDYIRALAKVVKESSAQ